MFFNREEAGKILAQKLLKYQNKSKAIILAIPRGGVLVAKEVAEILKLPLDLIIVRKLPMPDDPEAGIGAISESGLIVWQPQKSFYPPKIIAKILAEQKGVIKQRIKILRGGRKLVNLKDKTVILIDDGIAMGSTIEAAIATVRVKGAAEIVVAVPVGGREIIEKIRQQVDELICLEIPRYFYAVAQVYQNWYDVSDEEVIKVLKIGQKERFY